MNDVPNIPPADSPAPGGAEDPAFENLLRSAMQARPEPKPPADLALRAMALANVDETVQIAQRTRQLARQRVWAQCASLAAALLIVATLAVALRHMWTRGDITALTSASTSSTAVDETAISDTTGDETTPAATTSSAATSSSSTTSTIAVVFVAEVLVLGIILMSMSRRAPTMPWGAEAMTGLW